MKFSHLSFLKSPNHPGSQDLLSKNLLKNSLELKFGSDKNKEAVLFFINALSTEPFHFQVDQPFKLNAIFHGKFSNQVIDESVDAHTHCITFGQTSLLHVKDLFGAYLRYASLVLDGIIITLYGNCRISVSLTVTIDKQTIAFSIVFTFFQMPGDLDNPR